MGGTLDRAECWVAATLLPLPHITPTPIYTTDPPSPPYRRSLARLEHLISFLLALLARHAGLVARTNKARHTSRINTTQQKQQQRESKEREHLQQENHRHVPDAAPAAAGAKGAAGELACNQHQWEGRAGLSPAGRGRRRVGQQRRHGRRGQRRRVSLFLPADARRGELSFVLLLSFLLLVTAVAAVAAASIACDSLRLAPPLPLRLRARAPPPPAVRVFWAWRALRALRVCAAFARTPVIPSHTTHTQQHPNNTTKTKQNKQALAAQAVRVEQQVEVIPEIKVDAYGAVSPVSAEDVQPGVFK